MKYLNEKIEVTVPFSQTTEGGIYNYIINSEKTTLFYGTCFISKGQKNKRFIINDILQNYQYINFCFNPSNDFYKEEDIIEEWDNNDYVYYFFPETFTVEVSDGTNIIGTGTSDSVCLVNRYPVYKNYMGFQTHLKKWISDDSWTASTPFMLNLQGIQNINGWKWEPLLKPHYPLINTNNYSMIGLINNSLQNEVKLQYGDFTKPTTIFKFQSYGTMSFNFPMSTFYNKVSDGQDVYLLETDESGDNSVIIAGVFDGCPAKYYLQWQDRLGSVQSQPFDGTDTISFNYEANTITNSFGEKRVLNNEQTIKWKINTGWINEKLYPFYESIFVSPYLRLYDSENDISYQVLVTDKEFTEKTFANNSHQMFNLTLNLELNKTQKCLW